MRKYRKTNEKTIKHTLYLPNDTGQKEKNRKITNRCEEETGHDPGVSREKKEKKDGVGETNEGRNAQKNKRRKKNQQAIFYLIKDYSQEGNRSHK